MALSGSLKTNAFQTRYYQLSWTATQSIENNTSTISWKLQALSGQAGWYAERDVKVVIAGNTVFSKTDFVQRYAGTVKTGTLVVPHNADGTKNFSASVSVAVYYSTVNETGSKNFTLDTIPRTSTVSVAASYIGAAANININRATSSFKDTLTYAFGSLSGTIATQTSSTSISWTVPTTFYTQIPNAKSGQGTITCTTYNGSTVVGTSTAPFTVSVSDDNAPTVAPTVKDVDTETTAITGDANVFIQGMSDAQFNAGAAAKNSATIKSYKVTCGNQSSTAASGTFTDVTSGTFTFTVTDSRGFVVTKTLDKTLIKYSKPSASIANQSFTTDGVIKFDIRANFYDGNIGNTKNTLTVQYRYKTSGGSYSDWTAATATKGTYYYTAPVTISGLNYRNTYTVQARAIDKISSYSTKEVTLSCMPVFDWGRTNFNHNTDVTFDVSNAESGTKRKLQFKLPDSGLVSAEIQFNNTNYQYGIGANNGGNIHLADNKNGGTLICDYSPVANKVSVYKPMQINGATTTNQPFTVNLVTADEAQVNVNNSKRKGRLVSSTGGSFGLYDVTNNSWVIQSNTSKDVYIPHSLHVTGGNILLQNGKAVFWANAAGTNTSMIFLNSSDTFFVGVTDIKTVLRGKTCVLANGATITSDARLKHDIKPLDDQDSFFDKLKPVTYHYNNDKEDSERVGFIAQDVAAALNSSGKNIDEVGIINKNYELGDDEQPVYDEDGKQIKSFYALDYNQFIAMNTHQIQKLKSRVSDLQKEVADLKARLDKVQK